MFIVQHTVITDDIALAKFSCHLTACKGACCVVGEAGAPVSRGEVRALNKAYDLLKDELPEEARHVVSEKGLVWKSKDNSLELASVNGAECVFVTKNQDGVALCSIQKAWLEGRSTWIKPISCHLYPIRILTIGAADYLNFEFIPEICQPGLLHGRSTGTYLAESLEEPLVRKYGREWFDEFIEACRYIRNQAKD